MLKMISSEDDCIEEIAWHRCCEKLHGMLVRYGPGETLIGTPYLQGESAQAQLQKAQEQQQALAARLQETLEQRQGLEATLQLHMQEESGLIAMLAEDFTLSSELQQRLSAESETHATAVQELRNQVATPRPFFHACFQLTPSSTGC